MLADSKGDENFRLFAVDRDGKNQIDLTPYDKVRAGVVDDLVDIPNEMLIQLNKENPQVFDVYRIDVNTGEMKVVGQILATFWLAYRSQWKSKSCNNH